MKMSRPRTRSQGPLETEIVDGSKESQHIATQRRLSRELQVRLETLGRSTQGGQTYGGRTGRDGYQQSY